ncbi:hypothetical protein NP493_989g02000 [Ridgeia piscesae]|uniref:ATP synthase F(0) complex subunit e, mitochondrial n=1 Tax=Ridgeia piscesae TaxID=27915 RepID=A0AAD9KJ83_RIDPI|nr:hypothetical protein NP493_989g02000 [Ridgeia piscesae]
MTTLAAPRAVSPFIRACRWGALVTGVTYGFLRYAYLNKKEVRIQAREKDVRARIAAREAANKEELSRREMEILAKEVGSEF